MSQLSEGIQDLYRRATIPFCRDELGKAVKYLKDQNEIIETCDVNLNELI